MTEPSSIEHDKAVLMKWRWNPEAFAREALNFEPSNQQVAGFEELRKLVSARMRKMKNLEMDETDEMYLRKMGLSIMSGHTCGKDAFLAVTIIWFLICFPYPKVLITAPTFNQISDVLWAEVSKWLKRENEKGEKPPVADLLEVKSDKVYLKEMGGREWFAIARTANPRDGAEEQAETLAGRHEDYMFVGVDEASGVPEPVFKPLEGGLTGPCNFILMIFNPTRSKGFAVESQFQNRQYWSTLRWNAEESNITSKEAIDRLARKYGKDSNYYRIRVLGLPPKAEDNVLIPWEWVESAVDREIEPLDTDVDVVAIDVGAGSDPTILLHRRGPKVFPLQRIETPESEKLTGWILRQLFDIEPAVVYVDIVGVGWGIEGNLRARTPFNIIGLGGAESTSEIERFHRLRDELFWKLREKFEFGHLSIPNDDELVGELTTIRYENERLDGKIKVESKKDMRKRGVESPNKADALAMTEYYDTPMVRQFKKQAGLWTRRDTGLTWKTI